MTKLTTEITIEELQYRIHAHENDLTQMWTADYFLNVQKELLALKQAAKNPVAWTDRDELEDANKGYSAYLFALDGEANKYADPRRKIMLYTAPPAKPVIPDEIIPDQNNSYEYVDGWNACRAEMLKAQPVSEPYKLNGWISVDSELPEENVRVLAFSDGAFVLMTEFTGGEFYDVVRNGGEFFETVTRCVTHWMPLPAAPSQDSE